MDIKRTETRPIYLNLLRIRQPITAITSIGHRISGVLLFLSIPCMIWMLERSLASPESYQALIALFDNGFIKLVMLLFAWSLAHHFFAGIRFLFLDIDWGVDIKIARKTALVVNVLGVVSVVIATAVLL